jgi:hypothetical protein
MGKQLHRLPLTNGSINAITDVGLDETSPTYGLRNALKGKRWRA